MQIALKFSDIKKVRDINCRNVIDIMFLYAHLTDINLSSIKTYTKRLYSGGQFSGDIVAVISKLYLRAIFIIKEITIAATGYEVRDIKLDKFPMTFDQIYNWRTNMLFSTLPEEESNNLLAVNRDTFIRRWNKQQLRCTQDTLYVALTENLYKIDDVTCNTSRYISMLHYAKGISLKCYIKSHLYNISYVCDIIERIGKLLASFHLKASCAHLDLNPTNIFIHVEHYPKRKARFTLIDNHSCAFTFPHRKKTDFFSMLFAFDRNYFAEMLKHFLGLQSNDNRFCLLKSAFLNGYKTTFVMLSRRTLYTYIENDAAFTIY